MNPFSALRRILGWTGDEGATVNGEDGDLGAPVGRRIVLGLLALGAAGVAARPRISGAVGRLSGALSTHDPTDLSSLIPGNGFRYYSVTEEFPFRPPSSYR